MQYCTRTYLEHSKYRKIVGRPGLHPRPHCRSSQCSVRPPSWWREGWLPPPQEPHPCVWPFGPQAAALRAVLNQCPVIKKSNFVTLAAASLIIIIFISILQQGCNFKATYKYCAMLHSKNHVVRFITIRITIHTHTHVSTNVTTQQWQLRDSQPVAWMTHN